MAVMVVCLGYARLCFEPDQYELRAEPACRRWRLSEPLRPQQRVGEIDQQAHRDEAGERIVEDHGCAPLWNVFSSNRTKGSKSIARIGVADGGHEEAQPKGQHDDVQPGILPV